MLQMVQAINQDHIAQLPARGEPNIEVTCVTCHAGRNRPTTLEQEVSWALADGGIEAMRARYAELRERYFGMGAEARAATSRVRNTVWDARMRSSV